PRRSSPGNCSCADACGQGALRASLETRKRLPTIMRYQLVLRFPGDAFEAFEEIVELEAALSERLGDLILLDSREMGSDECSIVVLTTDPRLAFSGMSPVLDRKGLLEAVVA